MFVEKSQSDFGRSDLRDFTENYSVFDRQNLYFLAADYDSTNSEDMKHVYIFKHANFRTHCFYLSCIFSQREAYFCIRVCLRHSVYDAHSVTIYKMYAAYSVLIIYSDFKSCVYSKL